LIEEVTVNRNMC